jgi:uncharacterized membrane protein SpoIIM required for sporulation
VDDPRATLLARREHDRARLTELLQQGGLRPKRLGPDRLLEVGTLYRRVAADLAVLRRRFPGDPEIANHERLVMRAQSVVYAKPKAGFGFWHFVTDRYWQQVWRLRWHLALSIGLMVVSTVIAFVWARTDPATAARFFPIEGGMRSSYEDMGMSVGEQTAFSAEIFTNNIRVSFLAFALGITAGIGTIIVVLYNSLMLGTVMGLAVNIGNGTVLFALIIAHGVLELSVIAVAAAAGTRLGWAMLAPGNRSWGHAVATASRHAVEVVLGTIPWFVIAGLIEGFVTPAGLGPTVAGVIGVSVGLLYWLLVWWRGKPNAASVEMSRDVDFDLAPAVPSLTLR